MTVKSLKFNPKIGWVDTGVNVAIGEQFQITAKGKVSAYANKNAADTFGDEEWNDPNGSPTNHLAGICGGTLVPSLPDMMLIGKIGVSGSIFAVGRRVLKTAATAGRLYLTVNDCNLAFSDNRGYFNIEIVGGLPGQPKHNAPCPCGNDQKKRSKNPIELGDGNKVLTITDFSIQTATESLTFEREYNQEQRNNAQYQFMGMGWSHNHLYTLVLSGLSPSRTADVFLPNGGVLKLDEISTGQFVAQAGSNSSLSVSGANYLLTVQDKTVYEFEPTSITNQFRLQSRTWPTTEAWAYTYTSDKLTLIDDGYGRQLKFSYVASADYDDGQLWRVGDQTATGLDTGSPNGRYIEFNYTPEKNNGVLISTPKALLASVRDVRAFLWEYHYYGQLSGENNSVLLNLMTKRISPAVDTTGDGVDDSTLTLEELSYTYSGINLTQVIQKRGDALLETTFDIRPNNRAETRETVVGISQTHLFTEESGENGAYLGVEMDGALPVNNPVDDSITEINPPDVNFRLQGQINSLGNVTELDWSTDGKHLNSVTDALSHETTFSYNVDDTLSFSVDAQNRKTEYHYGNVQQPRLPTRIRVFDTDAITILRWQEFSYDTKGRTLTEELRNPVGGVTILQRVSRTYGTSGTASGLLTSITQEDLIQPANNATTLYTYDTAGRVIKTQKTSLFGTCEFSYTVYDQAGNVLATVCGPQNASPPATVIDAIAMYTINNENKVTTYAYDSLGRRTEVTTNAGAAFEQTSLTFYDALDRVIRIITNYVNQSSGSAENPALWVWSVMNKRWEKSSSNTTSISHGTENTQNIINDTSYNARNLVRRQMNTSGHVVLYGYNRVGRLIKLIQNASVLNYNNDYIGSSPDPTLSSYSTNTQADQDIITIHEFDASGNQVKSIDVLNRVTYTVYDALNRPIKTVRHAKANATTIIYDNDPAYIAANDPRSNSYVPSVEPDLDHIETTEYDSLGRVIRTSSLMENRAVQEWSVTLFGYDALGRQIKVIRSASNATYNINADPDLSGYVVSTNPDLDIVTRTVYDTQGRTRSTFDTLGAETRLVYDGMNRQVKTIVNFIDQGEDPALWVWSDTNNRWQTSSLAAIDHGVKNDQNIVTENVYDSDGHMLETRDVAGRVARNVYDANGRLVRTVQNYVAQGTSDPLDWVYNNGWKQNSGGSAPAISHGTSNDENQISSTIYDTQQRVHETQNHQNNMTRYVYDELGRRAKTITNYVAQGATDPINWEWSSINNRWENGTGIAIDYGTDKDQNRINAITYDLLGRTIQSRDAAGLETRTEYDATGRAIKTTANFIDGNFNPAQPDEDLISTTVYNKSGQVLTTTDVRGTQTAFNYDKTGRRLMTTQAAGSSLATTNYTCYDKAGRVLRTIINWSNAQGQPAPDSRNPMTSEWLFAPSQHGQLNDRDLITTYEYDRLSRQIKVTDPTGSLVLTSYFKDGQINTATDPEGVISAYCYDALRRRVRVIQSYINQGQDPSLWIWNSGWKKSDGTTAIVHGALDDENVIVDLGYDIVGHLINQREPRGNVTTYTYDKLNRRTSLTNPLSKTWSTVYDDTLDGKTQTTMTMPGITSSSHYEVVHQFDRLGRPLNINYGAPTLTPDITFGYDDAGNRVKMSEFSTAGFTSRIRETNFGYDDIHRLASVGFDNNGNGAVDETVSYAYDAGGLRTRLTIPGSLDVTYTYDVKGQLISLIDWDNQRSSFAYDNLGRQVATERANGLISNYQYDASSRLRLLQHSKASKTLAAFVYEVDKRDNRTQATEMLAQPATTNDVTILSNDSGIVTHGTWSDVSSFKESSALTASLHIGFVGDEATLTMGTGTDHGIYDVYIDGSLWQSFDGYEASPSERNILIPMSIDNHKLSKDGLHVLEIRVRAERHPDAIGNKVRFKQLVIADREYTLHTIRYNYDKLERLREARYAPGLNGGVGNADLLRRYQYIFDLAGNRTQQIVTVAGIPTTTNYIYNAANQMTSDGTNTLTYDDNGNLTHDGVNAYAWNRANRMLSVGDTNYAYDGLGNRISQTVGVDVTQYLLDLQPGLATVLQSTQGVNTTRYIHAPRGIHAQQDASDAWTWTLQDGLGSVGSVVDNNLNVLESRLYEPYGNPLSTNGSRQTVYDFTGEMRDESELVYLRARYYAPNLGVFTALDPLETANRFAYVRGNPVNLIDPLGLISEHPDKWSKCSGSSRKIRARLKKQSGELYNEPICPWADIELEQIGSFVPRMRELAASWNRIHDSSGNISQTGIPDEVFVATMAAILRMEGVIRQRVSHHYDMELRFHENGLGPYMVPDVNTAQRQRNERGATGYVIFNNNSSLGIANIRPSVFDEIFEGRYDIPGHPEPQLEFIIGNRLNSYQNPSVQMNAAFIGNNPIQRQLYLDSFYNSDDVALTFLAANLLRATERAQNMSLQPSIFNISGYHNHGRQGQQLIEGSDFTAYNSYVVRDAWRVLEGPCDIGLSYNGEIPYYNENEENLLRPDIN